MASSSVSHTYPCVPSHALTPYLLIVFVVTWGPLALYILLPEQTSAALGEITASHPVFMMAVYSPAMAAIGIVLYRGGLHGLKSFLSRLFLWRCSRSWYAYLIFGIPLIYALGSLVKGNFLDDPFPFEDIGAMFAVMAFMLVLGPVEEFGWRGVALPLLQRRYAPVWAGLILGLIWGLWHLPAFFLSGTPQGSWDFLPFFVGTVCLSVIVTPLFNASGGSILLPVLYHFQIINPLWPDAQPYDSYLFLAAAFIAVWVNRESMFRREGAMVEVIPHETRLDYRPEMSSR